MTLVTSVNVIVIEEQLNWQCWQEVFKMSVIPPSVIF
jgi:hypothetical protein